LILKQEVEINGGGSAILNSRFFESEKEL